MKYQRFGILELWVTDLEEQLCTLLFSSDLPYWTNTGKAFAPKDGYFMDPVSFYKLTGPY